MEQELARKIAWLEGRHERLARYVELKEKERDTDRSPEALAELKAAKKEKLRLKDMIAHLELLKVS